MFLLMLPLEALLLQTALASFWPRNSNTNKIRVFVNCGKLNLAHAYNSVSCMILCKNIRKGVEGLNRSCQLLTSQNTGIDGGRPCSFVSLPETSSRQTGASSNSSTGCLNCGVVSAPLAFRLWSPYQTDAFRAPQISACFDFAISNSRKLVSSGTSPPDFDFVPEQPYSSHCSRMGILSPPLLHTKRDVDKWLDHFIQNHKVVVFAKSTCPYCFEAINAIQNFTQTVCTVMIDKSPFMSDIQRKLRDRTGQGTVPRVYIRGKFVGGCDDVLDLVANNALQTMLRESGEE